MHEILLFLMLKTTLVGALAAASLALRTAALWKLLQ